jgi:hypothetical protein
MYITPDNFYVQLFQGFGGPLHALDKSTRGANVFYHAIKVVPIDNHSHQAIHMLHVSR